MDSDFQSPYTATTSRRQTPAPSHKVLDPLLSNLSPSSTLQALYASTNDLPPQDALHESVAAVSSSERSIAIRAATAAKRLKEWVEEVEQWESPQHPFEHPDHDHPDPHLYYGSLPADTVHSYEHRVDEIREAMEALQLDDLKMHVRSTSTASHHPIDDFTAIVTTTVMQALPTVYRLEALLSAWHSRLAVLRASPGFTDTLFQAQQEMAAAWQTLDGGRKQHNPHVSPSLVHGLKVKLESQIRDLGQRLDFILDTLEGRQDTVPDRWIDDMEQLELDYANWVVAAEICAVDVELRKQAAAASRHPNGDRLERPTSKTPPVQEPSIPETINGMMDGTNDGLPHLSRRPLPLNLHQHRRNYSNALSDVSYPGSATSDYFSDMSSPEIHDASKAEYFGVGSPVEVTTPGLPRRESTTSEHTVFRQSSQRTEREDSVSRGRASTVTAEPAVDEHKTPANNELRDTFTGIDVSNSAPPLPARSGHRFEQVTDLSPNSTPVKIIRRKTAAAVPSTPNRMTTASPNKSTGDQLEARISSILTDIPANIRLARSSDTCDTVTAASSANLDTKNTRKSPMPRMVRAQTAAPSSHTSESDVRLYHLHQPGKGPPVKLFVRLVGEGERVMVRIGGGWADLAEYLKEYAVHHGRRTASGGQFDIQGLPSAQSSSPATTNGSLSNSQTPERSAPAVHIKSRRSSNASAGLGSPCGVAGDYSDGFRPPSRDSIGSRQSWIGAESPSLGLAGPKSRKAAISPNKQAWVDTMIEKARHGSSEKKQGSRDPFGDMGIIGGTKRLFMKKGK